MAFGYRPIYQPVLLLLCSHSPNDVPCLYFIHLIQCFSPVPTLHKSVVAVITLHGYTCSHLVAAKHFSHHFVSVFVTFFYCKISGYGHYKIR